MKTVMKALRRSAVRGRRATHERREWEEKQHTYPVELFIVNLIDSDDGDVHQHGGHNRFCSLQAQQPIFLLNSFWR